MLHRTELGTGVGRLLAFGGIALVGGMLALAQVAAPPDPARARPAAEGTQGTAAQPRTGTPARQPGAADRTLPPADDRTAGAAGQAESRRGLGLEFDAQVREGLSIASIQQDSIAAQAGLRPGDRLVTVDGRTFATPRQLQAYLSGQYGRRVPVIIERGGQQYNVHLSMSRPDGEVAWLGVFLQDNEAQQTGARVMQVYPAGPAARAGLRPGDVIQQVNKQPVPGAADLIGFIEEMKPGEKAEFMVTRGQQQVAIAALLGSRDQFVFYRGQDEGQLQDESQFGEEDEFGNIPPYAMQLEHDRRMAEQHQRLEEELRKLQEEVRKLREALQPRN